MKPVHTAITLGSAALVARSTAADDHSEFLDKVTSGVPATMIEAWEMAPGQDPAVIAELANLTLSEEPPTAKCAHECIAHMVHSVGQSLDLPKREGVCNAILALLDHEAEHVKVVALRSASLIATGQHVDKITPFLKDDVLREETLFCLERIPGEEATRALIEAYDVVPDLERQRVVVALGHRDSDEVLPTLAQALNSDDVDLQLEAMKAAARLGKKPPSGRPPAYESLTERQKRKYVDAYLRMVDAEVARAEYDEPIKVCQNILNGEGIEDEHFHCAAVVVLAKIDRPEAVEMMIGALDAEPYILRITARDQLIAMKGSSVDSALKSAHESAEGDTREVIAEILEARG